MSKRKDILEQACEQIQRVMDYRTRKRDHRFTDVSCFKFGVADRFLLNQLISLESQDYSEIETEINEGCSAEGLLRSFFSLYGISALNEREGEENERGYDDGILVNLEYRRRKGVLDEPPAKKYLQYYMSEAVEMLENELNIVPDMGEKMLIRRYMEEACSELTGLKVGCLDYFGLADEAVARFFCLHYQIPASNSLLNTIVRGHKIPRDTLQQIQGKRGDK